MSSPFSSSSVSVRPSALVPAGSAITALTPVVLAVFLGFLAISVPLAALALEVRDTWGFGPGTVGWAIGLQSLATLLTRHQAGALCDRRGPRTGVLLGLPLAACAGLAYVLCSVLPLAPLAKLAVLMLGRLLAGLGESLFLTGLMSWGIARVGPARTGQVMSWTGMAIFAALGLGAPLGLLVRGVHGFAGVGVVALATPLLAWLVALWLAPVPAAGGQQRVPFHRVLGLIWRPGVVLALATVPYAALAAFLTLSYAAHGWPQAGAALLAFSVAYILVRLMGSGLPHRFGAARVAMGSMALEAIGQLLIGLAPAPQVALLGAVLTGLGFSLVFPSMGVLATQAVPPEQRGRAVGNFIAFADIAMGVTGPVLGFATHALGINAAFFAGAGATCAALGLLLSVRLGNGS